MKKLNRLYRAWYESNFIRCPFLLHKYRPLNNGLFSFPKGEGTFKHLCMSDLKDIIGEFQSP